ncbi:MAG: protein kinase, partial [Holophagales bacterium]|nr:protein kinase [Holophagales bacterium]
MDRIGKYEVLDQIGSGGFATVFKGYDPFIKRPVAIKICYSRDAETRQRFYREAEIAGRLVHRNITTVHDFGVHDENPYLVEEYLPGEDLAHLIRRREP